VYGLEILMLLDEVRSYKEDSERKSESLKLALLARQEYSPEKIFPKSFQTEDEVTNSDDVEYDYSRVEWKSPKDMDAEERDKLMAMVQKGASRMDFSQVEPQSRGEWV
jgi:hypothetical protein